MKYVEKRTRGTVLEGTRSTGRKVYLYKKISSEELILIIISPQLSMILSKIQS